jgi:hypothetical protein
VHPMADEEAVAPIEQAAPAIETVATETTTEPTVPVDETERIPGPDEVEATGEGDAEQQQEQLSETDELEFGFEKYTVPKKLKEAIETWRSATTKKEQEVAERRKALDAEFEQRSKATDDELRDRSVLLGVNAQIEQYKDVDWVTLARTDPVGYNEHRARFDHLRAAAEETAASLKTKQAERTQKAERELANRVEETLKFAREKIPGFKPELIENLVQFAQAEGIPEEAIKANWSPALLNLLHKANIGNLTLQKQANLPKPAPAIPLTPLTTVSGKTTPAARTDLASADMEAYVAARRAGVGGRPIR